MRTSLKQITEVVEFTVEAVSIRSVARKTGLNPLQWMKIIRLSGRQADRATDNIIASNGGVYCRSLQADELWGYVHTKQGHLKPGDPEEWGNQYVFAAIDPETKFVVCVFVGKRDVRSATIFFQVLRSRLRGTTQITTDAWQSYPDVIEDVFGNSSRYAQVGGGNVSWNNPDPDLIRTAIIERFNGTLRSSLRRLTRKCYGFSKSLPMLTSAVGLAVGHYTFCRVHGSLNGRTPAMAAGLTDRPWTVAQLLASGKTLFRGFNKGTGHIFSVRGCRFPWLLGNATFCDRYYPFPGHSTNSITRPINRGTYAIT